MVQPSEGDPVQMLSGQNESILAETGSLSFSIWFVFCVSPPKKIKIVTLCLFFFASNVEYFHAEPPEI